MPIPVRTRFAPSPTGYMHIGNLRTALYAYLIARARNGQFILRIEDTDQERLVEGSVEVIYNTLNLVGLEHDEGPDIGGPFGPYVQSQRKGIYKEWAEKLISRGGAYYCFCSKEKLESLRKEAGGKETVFKYQDPCREIAPAEAQKRAASGEPCVVRQRIPRGGTTTFQDMVYGSVTVENDTLEDGILLKSDGLPTYNFANVVDDHLMQISHVIRGSEYLSSAPKYNLIYQAMGWEIPAYIHLPLIMKAAGKKLSKREGDASFEDFYHQGYLKEAIVNYIALLGWNPKDDREIFSLDELKQIFSVSGLNNSPAIFDPDKLKWMNAEYIRKLAPEQFNQMAMPYYQKAIKRTDIDLLKLSKLVQLRTEVLSDIPAIVDFIDTLPEYDVSLYVNKKMKTDPAVSLESLKLALSELEKLGSWEHQAIHDTLFKLIEQKGLKTGQMLWPIRTALSGKESSPGGAIDLAEVLGKEETIGRITSGIKLLSKPS
ncbi:MAG: glutamate--tRNA ligase [Candidatus Edwardsbacteria bacterium RIFOXYD12_FULL_50_11]|uniref:Glutamate--tRNA ligase n=1 Tax=Candidatus Edwardsbacteria bacterium GWF2_54_11 TaxID=1817851 RepID=A0A1F5RCE4_9BACT|nr:MAG: glutamate--tRNA ligase [Candidatus Edwardsbacteria bacterium RifOxyC12_full_54_24]OGF07627.1 MAG: glutamate--tRNA ligase [Candidatus Edwardsbacteria bacterium RifOxyA12_full_54_48]OGF09878.1 MAG: glutamate--tRNA ligase [Candidatus Edwardsbacteria bacterium GWE2_54_12]OGF12139.1 MAG: glutamate--tRNA ligase [Candidatus Edwardsbacteria bacterium GWF2_54_11]OGF16239.1 MAG: glutamate--tRNA ligase [Candidatus Edwardsbacteria bacterium RIFOXYD12_FULL_50_11]OGJ19434.1 MAG: glutamate--tRNA liga